ncbi:uncharacterized protein LOC131333833 isoform X4 [Rhododendron vialii]|uniref:uncharacterized protein LOC131333833 isoform X4 n=1 Tax=Rhododendron vialii TaxID=182163 RepID=UPI00265E0EC9|nr:uncharacterized protein LOC131333833 isoform X4 [Rhododendron vialii]
MHDGASLEHQRQSSLEVGSQLGSKTVKAKSKSLGNVTRVQRNVSSELHKVDAKKAKRIERESSRTTKSEKQSPQTAAPAICSVHRTSKPEVSKSSKLEVVHANKRGICGGIQKQQETRAQIRFTNPLPLSCASTNCYQNQRSRHSLMHFFISWVWN